MEVDRIEKQFDDCIAFLLRVNLYSFFILTVFMMGLSKCALVDVHILMQLNTKTHAYFHTNTTIKCAYHGISFSLQVLSFKLNVGHFPHLADLVTRINYNYFYMSDTGNLMIAPSSETVGLRVGKAFASRTD